MAISNGFNNDLATEILLRLPVKSILRLKTVSKEWLSIASSPRFRQIHAASGNIAAGLFFPKNPLLNQELEFIDFGQVSSNTFPFMNNYPKLISSSGGLLLFQTFNMQMQPMNHQILFSRDYFISNPATKEFKRLSIPQLISASISVSETLAFDPCKSPHYKILFLCETHARNIHNRNSGFQIVIYSSETETFGSPTPSTTSVFDYRFRGIYCNDAIIWITIYKPCFNYFDLKRECMKESPMPLYLYLKSKYFGESQGRLHLVTVEGSLLGVHELKSDFSGWFIKYEINLTCLAKSVRPIPENIIYSAICNGRFNGFTILVDKEEDVIMLLLIYGVFVRWSCKKMMVVGQTYDPRLCMPGNLDYLRQYTGFWPLAHHYIETLACV